MALPINSVLALRSLVLLIVYSCEILDNDSQLVWML
jgi:hypothetical protein